MATLTGSTIKDTYEQLIKLDTETLGADASAKFLETGKAEDTPISVSTTRVGIGTAAPDTLLTLADATNPILTLSRGTDTSEVAIINGEILGQINFSGHDSGSYEGVQVGAFIRGEASAIWGSDDIHDAPGELQFFVQSNGDDDGTTSPRMTITSDGGVGIGTSAPGSELEIAGLDDDTILTIYAGSGTNAEAGILKFQKSSNASTMHEALQTDNLETLGRIDFYGVTNASPDAFVRSSAIVARQDGASDATAVLGSIEFQTSDADDDGNPTISMKVDSASNLGIGTADVAFSSGAKCLGLLNGTDPGGATTNTAGLFASGGELYSFDSGNTTTILSPPTSDERLKENIVSIPDALTRLQELKGVTYNFVSYKNSSLPFKDKIEDDVTFYLHNKYGDDIRVGVIAQDVERAYDGLDITNAVMELPVEKAIKKGDEKHIPEIYGDVKRVGLDSLVPLLIEAVKELSAKVEALENA